MTTVPLPHPDYPARPPVENGPDPLDQQHADASATASAACADVEQLTRAMESGPGAPLVRTQRLGKSCAFCGERAVESIAAMRLCDKHLGIVRAIAADAGRPVTVTHYRRSRDGRC